MAAIRSSRHELRLGTRASALARTQSEWVARKLERLHRSLDLTVTLVEISTTGDKDRTSTLNSFGGTGVFVKELEQALLDGRIDFAVHSLKDLPTSQPKGLRVAAIPRREDVRDVAVVRDGLTLGDLPEGAVIGSGSARRRAQLIRAFPHLIFREIRGNVDTRIQKVRQGDYDGTILARAGLKRLARPEKDAQVLPVGLMLPAPGQGALGLECRTQDRRTLKWLRPLHDEAAAACVEAERQCLATLGGGCNLPLGALGKVNIKTGELTLRAALGLPDGTLMGKACLKGPMTQARTLGRDVARMLRASGDVKKILKALEAMEA